MDLYNFLLTILQMYCHYNRMKMRLYLLLRILLEVNFFSSHTLFWLSSNMSSPQIFRFCHWQVTRASFNHNVTWKEEVLPSGGGRKTRYAACPPLPSRHHLLTPPTLLGQIIRVSVDKSELIWHHKWHRESFFMNIQRENKPAALMLYMMNHSQDALCFMQMPYLPPPPPQSHPH